MALDFLLDVHFLDGEVVVDGKRLAGLLLEQAGFKVERIRQAVGRIDAHHQGGIAKPGQLQARGRRNTGFADAALTTEQQDTHTSL